MWKERGYTNMGVITQDQLKEIESLGTEPEPAKDSANITSHSGNQYDPSSPEDPIN